MKKAEKELLKKLLFPYYIFKNKDGIFRYGYDDKTPTGGEGGIIYHEDDARLLHSAQAMKMLLFEIRTSIEDYGDKQHTSTDFEDKLNVILNYVQLGKIEDIYK